MKFLRNPASGSRIVNALVLLILSVLLYAAFAWQFYINQTPCSPCFLQRLALVMVGAGLWLNVRIGPSPLRYAMATVASLAGVVLAGRRDQLDRTIGLRCDSYGLASRYLGCCGVWRTFFFSAFMLARDRKLGDNNLKQPFLKWGGVLAVLFLVAILLNAASIVVACGASVCPFEGLSKFPYLRRLKN